MPTMKTRITYHGLDRSDALDALIHERIAKLDHFFDHIHDCRVVVEEPHRSQSKHNQYRVKIDLSVPGREIVVTKEHHHHGDGANPYDAVRDAFDAAERQIRDYAERLESRKHETHRA